jgi:hypothetical protein
VAKTAGKDDIGVDRVQRIPEWPEIQVVPPLPGREHGVTPEGADTGLTGGGEVLQQPLQLR